MKAQYIKIDDKGNKYYYSDKKMSKLHRVDGPAIEYANGVKFWCIDGNIVSQEKHTMLTKKVHTDTINDILFYSIHFR